jgi:UbiD family decarboxylase
MDGEATIEVSEGTGARATSGAPRRAAYRPETAPPAEGSTPIDVRSWLAAADALGELSVVEGADAETSIGLVSEMLMGTPDAPATLFDRIPEYPSGYRVLVNALGSRSRLARTLGLPTSLDTFGLMNEFEQRLTTTEPRPLEYVEDGPIRANVMRGDDVDLLRFPTPMWHPEDGGRFIGTGDGVLTVDPDTDWLNMGTYRVMLHDRNHTGLYISPGKHGRIHREKYLERGEPMPAVILVGLSPLQFMASSLEIPQGISELEWVGGLLGQSVRCVRGEYTGIPFPADAEIALEGFLFHDRLLPEGPFGEWTGYYGSSVRDEPVFEVKAVYHRDDPILLGHPPQKPSSDAVKFNEYLRSANLLREIRAAGVPDIRGAWTHSAGGGRMFNVVSVTQRYAGHARQAGYVATQCRQGAYLGRITVVVDDDVDITDLAEVIWAVCTRADPERDMDILRGAWSGPLDPAIHPEKKGTNSRLIIDATRPWDWRDQFPVAIGSSPSVRAKVREEWGWVMEPPSR